MHLKFKAFRAVNDPGTCIKFKEEHRNVLRDYGISNITTNTDGWMYDPNVYCLVAESYDDGRVLGGVRIQVSAEGSLLPLELAVGKMDEKVHSIVKNFRDNGGVGELCALWNAKAVAGMGVSVLMVRAIVAASAQLPISALMCICADYTLQMFMNAGFVIDDSLGMNGEFAYPNANYTARVLGIMNPRVLDSANAYDKTRMQALRENPEQTITEKGAAAQIKVNYSLRISH